MKPDDLDGKDTFEGEEESVQVVVAEHPADLERCQARIDKLDLVRRIPPHFLNGVGQRHRVEQQFAFPPCSRGTDVYRLDRREEAVLRVRDSTARMKHSAVVSGCLVGAHLDGSFQHGDHDAIGFFADAELRNRDRNCLGEQPAIFLKK